MKKAIVFITLLLTTVISLSIAQKKVVKAVYTFDFPAESTPEIKEAYSKLFEKGRILYEITCAKCHNTVVQGVEVMPEFTKVQLANYEIRIKNPKHEESLNQMRVSTEELQHIIIFLSYCKKEIK